MTGEMPLPCENGPIPEGLPRSIDPSHHEYPAAIFSSVADPGSAHPSVALLELLHSPACILDGAGNIAHLNRVWREFAGLGEAGDAFLPWTRLLHPEERTDAWARFQSAGLAGARIDFECRLQDAHGGARWFLLSLHRDGAQPAGGQGWLCTGTDIHDFKCREFELERRASMRTAMLNVSVDCIKLISLDGKLIHMNDAGCHALGVASGSAFGMAWLPLLPDDLRVAGEQAIAEARAGACARFGGRSIVPGRKAQHWDNMLTPVLGADGRPTAILCVSREITAEHDALQSLRRTEERFVIATRVGGLGIWDYDIQCDVLHCDEHWYRIMGRDPANPITSIAEFRPFIHPDDVDRATEVMQTAAALIATESDYATIFRIVRPNGEVRWVRSAACLQEMAGHPARAIGFVLDITDARRGELALRDANRALEEERASLARQNLEDPLTGIANRRYLDNELARSCLRASEAGEALCVGMIDVDNFKNYNDRYGHLEGDAALRRIASAIQSVARKSDVVARFGGEEFAFVLSDTIDPAPVLDRLFATIAKLAIPHEASASGVVTISCGCIVKGDFDGCVPERLLKESDDALYEAKKGGRNRYVIR